MNTIDSAFLDELSKIAAKIKGPAKGDPGGFESFLRVRQIVPFGQTSVRTNSKAIRALTRVQGGRPKPLRSRAEMLREEKEF